MTRAGLLVFALVCAVGIGCAHKQSASLKNVSGAEHRIRKVRIEGNESLDDDAIIEHMNLQPTTWLPLPKKTYFLPGLVPVDRDRIEAYYAANGYHDASVVSFEPKYHNKRDNIVDLNVVVDEGQPTLIGGVKFAWPEGPPVGPPDKKAAPARIERQCGLARGNPFAIEDLEACRATMRAALQQRGFAFAEVETRAEVDRVARIARVEHSLVPGKFVRIGEIRFVGLTRVPEKSVRVEVEEFQGKPFSPTRIKRMEDAVYGLDVVSSVSIEPDDEPEGDRVGLTVTVTESKPQSIQLGVGLGLEPNRWEQYGAMRYTHRNLFRNLTRFDLKIKAGYAELPAIYDPEEHGPIAEVQPSLTKKGFLEKKLVWSAEPGFELGIWQGYQFYSPKTRLGVSRFFTRFFQLGLSCSSYDLI